MANYAKVVDGIVTRVISADSDFFDTFVDDTPGTWIQTSYNTYGNKHYNDERVEDDGTPLRKNYAGIGMLYDADTDAFYENKPYSSWLLDSDTYLWGAPVEKPDLSDSDEAAGKFYVWNENIINWTLADG